MEEENIDKDLIIQIISDFYEKAFKDGIIGHFFFGKSHEELLPLQITFTLRMLGVTSVTYQGRPLQVIHQNLGIRKVHFDRRKVLLKETMESFNLQPTLQGKWLELEDRLQNLIIGA